MSESQDWAERREEFKAAKRQGPPPRARRARSGLPVAGTCQRCGLWVETGKGILTKALLIYHRECA